ncbi:hypothetical protein [Streptomyces sp. 1331.2]|uniref:hypothetical protein n=1 Tax=Streptomyces sp. 1331.2 TaxID=1938835 RepID=UPI000BCC1FBB|nr:hypothetical protein [Streptomyces sp. 1331.2]SOB88408.1 hypothetical protein SAMN06272789_6689 [Streptomyces sp. 1331.2]
MTTAHRTEPTAERTSSSRHLLPEEGFASVVRLIQRDNKGIDEPHAVRIADEAIKFVVAAATHPGRLMRPSRAVDMGWHALLLHTSLYRALCSSAGRFVDHYPDEPGTRPVPTQGHRYALDAIRAAGFEPDLSLWPSHHGDCGACGGGCGSCGSGGDCGQRP